MMQVSQPDGSVYIIVKKNDGTAAIQEPNGGVKIISNSRQFLNDYIQIFFGAAITVYLYKVGKVYYYSKFSAKPAVEIFDMANRLIKLPTAVKSSGLTKAVPIAVKASKWTKVGGLFGFVNIVAAPIIAGGITAQIGCLFVKQQIFIKEVSFSPASGAVVRCLRENKSDATKCQPEIEKRDDLAADLSLLKEKFSLCVE
jgi:hypothetical protein